MRSTLTSAVQRQHDVGWICSSCLASSRVKAQSFASGQNTIRRRRITQNAKPRDGKLPDYPARTRFAPSPTGIMHIGGLRTALYSYLLAKRTRGQFLLRIEDTDSKRFVPGSIERLCEDLQWAGLQWDEGPDVGGPYGPYQQSHRTEIYQQHAKVLLEAGKAFRCFCPQVADTEGATTFVTSGCYQNCSSLSKDESDEKAHQHTPHTVRLKPATSTSPSRGRIPDLIFGKIQSNIKRGHAGTADDGAGVKSNAILLKSDGTPTYHFANVVDDHLMKITHVIRGTEWMASTPLHCDLYDAFGWQPPLFAHVPLLVDKNQAKLSKRNADLVLDVRGLKDNEDVLPETLVNFLALQGWSNPTRNDVMNMEQLIQNFDLKFTTGNVMVSMEKMFFLQSQHLLERCEEAMQTKDTRPIHDIVQKITERVPTHMLTQDRKDSLYNFCTALLLFDHKGFKTVDQFVERNRYLFVVEHEVPTLDVDETVSFDTDMLVGKIVQGVMMEQMMGSSPIVDQKVASGPAVEYAWTLDTISKVMNGIVVKTIWCAVVPDHLDQLDTIMTTTWDPKLIASQLASNESETAELLQKYQDRQKLVMKRLRQILCYGKPGPGIPIIMALLGTAGIWPRWAIATQKTGGPMQWLEDIKKDSNV